MASIMVGVLLFCAPAQAITLVCERGVAFGKPMGPRATYTLAVEDRASYVTAHSGGTTRKMGIVRRIETDGMRALVLDSGEPSVQATLVLWPNPRMELGLGGGYSQTDICKVS